VARAGRGGDRSRSRPPRGDRASAAYWFATELPRIHHLAALCRSAERSFVDLDPAWL
jgi:hypothetical protein